MKYNFNKHLQYYEKFDNKPETLVADIWFNLSTGKIEYKTYTDVLYKKPFGVKENPTIRDLDAFIESRCFPRERYNCQDLLEAMGLDHYEPYAIIKFTQGNCKEDHLYLRYVEDQND